MEDLRPLLWLLARVLNRYPLRRTLPAVILLGLLIALLVPALLAAFG